MVPSVSEWRYTEVSEANQARQDHRYSTAGMSTMEASADGTSRSRVPETGFSTP